MYQKGAADHPSRIVCGLALWLVGNKVLLTKKSLRAPLVARKK